MSCLWGDCVENRSRIGSHVQIARIGDLNAQT
jgi:hypothetical protein